MAYIKIDSEGRITAASKTHHCGDDEIGVTIPEEIGIESIHEYRYESGEFIHDPKVVEIIKSQPTQEERIRDIEMAINALLKGAE